MGKINKLLDPSGMDSTYSYKYDLVKDPMEGYVFTFTHTAFSVKADISGSVTWVDNNNTSKKRPNSMKVSLYKKGNDNALASTSIVPDSNGNWSYSFTGYPKFSGGEAIEYYIKADALDNYETTIDGYNITNVLKSSTGAINGNVVWDDSNPSNRPESVVLTLKANGKTIESKEIKNVRESYMTSFTFNNAPDTDVNGKIIEYTITQSQAPNYTTTVTKVDDGTYVVFNQYNDPTKVQYKVEAYSSNKACTTDIVAPKVSPVSYSGQYNEETEVTLSALSKYGYKFLGWYNVKTVKDGKVTSLGDFIQEGSSYSTRIDRNIQVVAVYEPNYINPMKPTARTGLVANGSAQELVYRPLIPLASDYTMKYAISASKTEAPKDSRFDEKIPEGFDAGTYYVWYKPFTDEYHDQLPAECIEVTIAKGEDLPIEEPEDVPTNPGEVKDVTDVLPDEDNPLDVDITLPDNPEEMFDPEDVALGVNVWVEVKPLSEENVPLEDKLYIVNQATADKYNVGAYYDIELFVKIGGGPKQQLHETGIAFLISFKTDSNLYKSGRQFKLARLHYDTITGKPSTKLLSMVYDEKTDRLLFASNLFSTYALVYSDENQGGDGGSSDGDDDKPTPDTNDQGSHSGYDPNNPNNTGGEGDSNKAGISGEYNRFGYKIRPAKTKDGFNIGYVFMSIIDKLF